MFTRLTECRTDIKIAINLANRFICQRLWMALVAGFGLSLTSPFLTESVVAQDSITSRTMIDTTADTTAETTAETTADSSTKTTTEPKFKGDETEPYIIVLGIAQDGGFPQAGCQKECCRDRHDSPTEGTACLAVVDPMSGQRWLFECTPNFPAQLHKLNTAFPVESAPGIDGLFLTHAHIGHYSGLVHLGREVMGTSNIPVHVMPRMSEFLQTNAPWSQLVELQNIQLVALEEGTAIKLNERISVTPITVPHRDEFSETVGFKVTGPKRSVLFLPDIDKWERWEQQVEVVIADVDVAFLDATFYDGDELPGRNMAEIPHPFVVESIKRFASLSESERNKIHFIHLNHTNPALDRDSKEASDIRSAGMNVAETLMKVGI